MRISDWSSDVCSSDLTLWLPRAYLARGVGMLTIGSAIGNGAGALISGPLLDLNGMLGLAGWQWIFLITGAIPVIGGIVILRYMRDGIDDATFLRSEEHTSELPSLMRISYAVFCLKKKT